jgi:hypothetical protein
MVIYPWLFSIIDTTPIPNSADLRLQPVFQWFIDLDQIIDIGVTEKLNVILIAAGYELVQV